VDRSRVTAGMEGRLAGRRARVASTGGANPGWEVWPGLRHADGRGGDPAAGQVLDGGESLGQVVCSRRPEGVPQGDGGGAGAPADAAREDGAGEGAGGSDPPGAGAGPSGEPAPRAVAGADRPDPRAP